MSPSKNPKGAYDAEGDGPLQKGDNSIIIQGLLSLRQTLQQEIRNVCSEICYDIQQRLGRDVAELRSDSENQLSCLKTDLHNLKIKILTITTPDQLKLGLQTYLTHMKALQIKS